MRLVHYGAGELADIAVRSDETIRQAMSRMSRVGLRFAPVVDGEGRFVGGVGDGDIRRTLAETGDLNDPVSLCINRKPITLKKNMTAADVRAYMLRTGIEHLPEVIDGRLVGFYVLWLSAHKGELTAVLMAGGLGTRLAPLTENCPKPLLHVGPKPILTHIIEHLRNEGVTHFVISLNYLGQMIVDHYGDGSDLDVTIDYVHETKRLGTGGALSLIDPTTLSDQFLVLNGDLLNDVDVQGLIAAHKTGGWDATMVVREYNYTVPYGVVQRGDDGGFRGAVEKPTHYFCINAGMYLLSKSVLPVVPNGKFYDLPTLFDDLTPNGLRGGTFTHHGRWIDIGSHADFKRAQDIFDEDNR